MIDIDNIHYHVFNSTTTQDIPVEFEKHIARYQYIAVKDISIPKTYYNLHEDAVLSIQETTTTKTFTLIAGTYSVDLMTILLNQHFATLDYPIAVTFPSYNAVQTGKLTFTSDGDNPILSTTSNRLASMLGIEPDTECQFVSNIFISTKVVNYQPFNSINLYSTIVSDLSRLLFTCHVNTTQFNANLVIKTPDIVSEARKINKHGHTYRFTLLSDTNETIDLNGYYVSITLAFFNMHDIKTDLLYINNILTQSHIRSINKDIQQTSLNNADIWQTMPQKQNSKPTKKKKRRTKGAGSTRRTKNGKHGPKTEDRFLIVEYDDVEGPIDRKRSTEIPHPTEEHGTKIIPTENER